MVSLMPRYYCSIIFYIHFVNMRSKTYKSHRHRQRVKEGYTKKLRQKPQIAGGLFTTSNSKRIVKRLVQLKTILDSQADEILKASKSGDKKKDKINLFVDKCVDVLLFNLFTIWNARKADATNTLATDKKYQELISELNSSQFMTDKKWQYHKLHKIYLQLHKLGYQGKTDFFKILDGNNSKNSKIMAGPILEVLYQLNDNWINEGAINTMKDPKFADLDRMWFNKMHETWFDRNYKWLWLLT